jgi:uncharacterized protein YdiU (UPF0061 family)
MSAPPVTFDNSYARLPARFFASQAPTPVAAPRLIRLNDGLAADLGLDAAALRGPHGVAMLAGNLVPAAAAPLAMAYAGHQFGNFVPQLGDGRAILLGEVVGRDGVRRDIQLKGAGRTPFSRGGDGRAALGPVLREYLVSEAMAALVIPTTRSLAAVLTGEEVFRDLPLAGAVLTRVAQSHVRVGTFQFFAARNDGAAVRTLADYIIARNYPEIAGADNPYLALLEAVIGRTASLIARWQLVGFIHGVMNTDNMSVAGETIDYGPCAFMDSFHPGTVYSSIDHAGRYAYGNQPRIALWNLTRLAETLLGLLADDDDAAIARAQAALERFAGQFDAAYRAGLRHKLGLRNEDDADIELARALFASMAEQTADYTLTFRYLSDAACGGADLDARVRALFTAPEAFDTWAVAWRARLAQEGGPDAARAAAMRAVNPAVIPRNHQVQAAIVAAQDGDFTKFEALTNVLSRPFEDQPDYMAPPRADEVVRQTFCGT